MRSSCAGSVRGWGDVEDYDLDPRAYQALLDEARALGIPTSLDDPNSPRTIAGLRAAVAERRASGEEV